MTELEQTLTSIEEKLAQLEEERGELQEKIKLKRLEIQKLEATIAGLKSLQGQVGGEGE